MINMIYKPDNIVLIIMICIGIILINEIYIALRKYLDRVSLIIAIGIVIAIAMTAYFAVFFFNKELLLPGTGIFELITILVYMMLNIILNTFKNIKHGYFSKLDIFLIGMFAGVWSLIVFILVKIGLDYTEEKIVIMNIIVLCLILLGIFYRIIIRLYQENYKGHEADKLRNIIESGDEYIKNVQTMDKQIRMVRHDIKNQIQIISSLLNQNKYEDAKEFIKEYSGSIDKISDYVHTEDAIFNTIVNNKIERSKSESIIITTGFHKMVKPMMGNDLYTIIGNLLDNAIEAELREDVSNREIEVRSIWSGDDMIIIVENYISHSVLKDNYLLQTSKIDAEEHGLGIHIVRKLVKRNKGICEFYETDDMFCCEIRW